DTACYFDSEPQIERQVRSNLEIILRKREHVGEAVAANAGAEILRIGQQLARSKSIPACIIKCGAYVRVERAIGLNAVHVYSGLPKMPSNAQRQGIAVLECVLNSALRNNVRLPEQVETRDADARNFHR